MRGNFLAHALGPEFRDVIGYAGNGVFALGAKEIADVIIIPWLRQPNEFPSIRARQM
jgi:hypothetical protein